MARTTTLKIKNIFIKSILALLGFTLSTSQCLAQYMAIQIPSSKSIYGRLIGISDTLRNFKVIINRDTVSTSWQDSYRFKYKLYYYSNSDENKLILDVDVPKDANYLPIDNKIAIKPDDDDEIEINFKKKNK